MPADLRKRNTTTGTELSPEYAELVDKLAELTVRRDAIDAQASDIKESLRKLGTGSFTVDGVPAVTIKANIKFSAATAAEVLDAATVRRISEFVVSTQKAKAHLAPNEYRQCQSVAGRHLVILAGG